MALQQWLKKHAARILALTALACLPVMGYAAQQQDCQF